jgi:mono/diheme cytochrome c family protein
LCSLRIPGAIILAMTLATCVDAAAPDSPASIAPSPDSQAFGQIEQGRYLTVVADCAACHTAAGGAPFAGGRPIETPFGVIVSPNITPERETGISAWSDDEFLRALQQGIGHDGKHLYPAMPYQYYTRATPADLLAIRAWLATIPAVRNKVVSNTLPFPLDIRGAMIAWDALFFTPGPFKPDRRKSAEWNRGAYLVTGLEHCGACHTPKNALGADDQDRALQGARLQGWFAPNITDDRRRGIGTWSLDDVVDYLRTGHNAAAAASGPMGEEVSLSSAAMSPADLRAMAVYLKDQPGQPDTQAPLADSDARMHAGAAIYADECSACHAPDGAGVAGLFPTLAGAPAVQSREPTSLVRVVLRGAKSVATAPAPTGAAMPAFGWMLSDAQVAAVTTYVRNAWGNVAPAVSTDDVAGQRKTLADQPQ